MSQATLLVVQGVDQGQRFELTAPSLGIGRGAQNEIRILDTEISRRHARLHQENEQWWLEDLGSANGSFLNGKPVKKHLLQNSDQLQLGRTILLFTQNVSSDDSRSVAEQIRLLARDPSDRSRIVGEIPQQNRGHELLAAKAGEAANLQLLYRISEEAVRPSLPLDQLLQRILDMTLEAVGADRGCMLVTNSRTDRIEPRVISHRPGVDVNEKMPISTGIVEYVIRQGQGVWTADAQHDARFNPERSILQAGILEALCAPMQGRYELMGVIYVDTTAALEHPATPAARRFSAEQLLLLASIARQSALAVENNRYQESLVTAERLAAVGQTIAILSHHIKNILQGVRGGSYLIDKGLGDHDEKLVRKGWRIVERNQDRIYHLVMDMLSFSKDRPPQLRPADLNEVVKEVCELMQARADELNITLERQFTEGIPSSQFDAEGIHRAVLNLVTNGLEALDGCAQGRLTVSTGFDAVQTLLKVEVSDNGPGIDPAELELIFNLFESNKGTRGTGLGLAVTRKILREHGGDVTVESRLNEGTTFRLSWPLILEDPHEAASPTLAGL